MHRKIRPVAQMAPAPHHRQALGTWSTAPQGGLDGCDFNPDAPDYQRFPRARDVTFLRVTLEAGDLLFLPEGWFHQVESVSTSLSVNFWVDSGRGWPRSPLPEVVEAAPCPTVPA